MRGRSIKLSLSRRFVVDLLNFSVRIPTVPVERSIDISALRSKLKEIEDNPPWSAIFLKGFGLVAREMPELRRVYLSLPRPHLYEYPVSVGGLMIERDFDGEAGLVPLLLKDPANQTLHALGRQIRDAKQGPIENIKHFRRILTLSRLPAPLRRAIWSIGFNLARPRANFFGTYGITTVGADGASTKHPLAPVTSLIGYGVFSGGGCIDVSGVFDHRVLDGATMARSLVRLEEVLNREILDELSASEFRTAHRAG